MLLPLRGVHKAKIAALFFICMSSMKMQPHAPASEGGPRAQYSSSVFYLHDFLKNAVRAPAFHAPHIAALFFIYTSSMKMQSMPLPLKAIKKDKRKSHGTLEYQ